MPRPSASGYSTRDVAALLGLSPEQVRSYVRAGVLSPTQGARGEYLFSFQDLILLRAAKGLLAARIPHRRIVSALENLQRQLPAGQPLTGVRITADGHRVVVRDGDESWHPDSGQKLLDFGVDELRREASSLLQVADRNGHKGKTQAAPRAEPQDAEGWFERGEELEENDADGALAAYGKALELDPGHADAHLNAGRLLHEKGDLLGAESHYRRAREVEAEGSFSGTAVIAATAAYNLGVVLQDLERLEEAAESYEAALAADPDLADAHYNLAGVYEALGNPRAAFRHLKAYRKLTG
ncbi:MAG TPA: tetratricopeptide repeat protein [Thermoanaerobaculia bacterium]|nr:tetratricopeptide repeat protein [Thermoanaerobaculia bacterium]